jgi:hypothetical protein
MVGLKEPNLLEMVENLYAQKVHHDNQLPGILLSSSLFWSTGAVIAHYIYCNTHFTYPRSLISSFSTLSLQITMSGNFGLSALKISLAMSTKTRLTIGEEKPVSCPLKTEMLQLQVVSFKPKKRVHL